MTYLEWILDLPWEESTTDSLDIEEAQRNMDEDHYGLEKIKKRIIEFLAVRKLKQDMHGPILCFVGPPGVGKTALGQSIARTMGRKFVRISLGGVRDEAEIRGHRRTYIGALPGRVSQSLRKAGSNNPLFMLDEIDANLSGEESMSVAKVLRQLSKHFQIYVISHQPQLTSMGDQHFLVYKDGEESKTKELDEKGKINEIARIISGDSVSSEAKKFAKELLEVNKCA